MDDFMGNEFRHGEGVGTRIFEKTIRVITRKL
jgi:hypothetical protein